MNSTSNIAFLNNLVRIGTALMASMSLARAAINVSGTTVYTQNFNTLPSDFTPTEFDWTDDTTVTGFYLHRSNTPAGQTSLAGSRTTAAARPYTTSGLVAANGTPNFHGFLSLGNDGDADRALGYCPTTNDGGTNWAGGTLSIVAIITNTGVKSTELTSLSFDLENWRGNSDPSLVETISVTAKVGAASALLAELGTSSASASFVQPGYNPVGGGVFDYASIDGFTASPAPPPGFITLSGPVSPPIRLSPGESLALRWADPNDGGTDAQVGIDNLSLSFTEVAASLVPVVSNVVRNNNGTPTVPADDTVNFTLTVTGLGAVSAGWAITSPPSLVTQTGTYGTPKSITGVPLADFSGVGHTMDISVRDSANATINGIVTVTTPWCAIQAAVTNVARQDLGNADPNDDTWSYTVTVTGQFTAPDYVSDNFAIPTGTYGVAQNVTGLSVIGMPNQTTAFFDNADPACTASVSANAPRIIGTKNFGTAQPLFTDSGGVPLDWTVDESALTQISVNGGAPAKIYRSEVVNLSAVGPVACSATLQVDDLTSGFEADDTFNAYVIVDGNAAAPVSLITAYDTLTPADGILTGAELTPATPGPPPGTGLGNFTFPLSAQIPASANSVQLVISGNENSDNELMTVHSIVFQISTDTDGDGLQDTWEIANFGNLSQTASGDFDRDGATNGNEFTAGTVPTNPASLLTILSVVPVAGGYNITWSSVPGKTYRVEFSTNLVNYTNSGLNIPASAGSSTSATLPVPAPVPGTLFVRIGAN